MTPLYGHDAAVAAFRDALDSRKLHHAWLISGPMGVGKATFARKAALRLLADGQGGADAPELEVPETHPAAKLFAAGSHPDFRLIEREVWEKDKIVPKHERSGSEALGKNIRVAQIRWMTAALGQGTAISDRRAVVIDSADDLEPGAANALLKSLEEPPANTTFFLVSHTPERLLPTIRSRCRQLRLSVLDEDAMTSALREALPDADPKEIGDLAVAGSGAPGRALAFRGLDVAGLDKAMAELVREGDPANARRGALAQSLALKSAQPRYEAFLARAPSVIAAEVKARRGPALAHALATWERAQGLAASARGLSLEPESVVYELAGMLASLAPSR